MSSYTFHPDAFADLDDIWEYIAQDNVNAADRVLADIHSTLTPARRITTDRTSTTGSDDQALTIPCRAR